MRLRLETGALERKDRSEAVRSYVNVRNKRELRRERSEKEEKNKIAKL